MTNNLLTLNLNFEKPLMVSSEGKKALDILKITVLD